jgi:hypothetical protein
MCQSVGKVRFTRMMVFWILHLVMYCVRHYELGDWISLSFSVHVNQNRRPWRWWQHFRPKYREHVTLHGVNSQKTVIWVPPTMKIWELNPLTPELNPSAQRCLTKFLTGDFASWTLHFVNICVKNQQMQQLLIQFINCIWYLLHVSAQMATHPVTRHNTPIHNILSTVPQLSISQKALGTLPEVGNVMPKHVGATMHN